MLLSLLVACACASAWSARGRTLTNGWDQAGTLVLQTTNSYTFYATNGDTVHARAGAPGFRPLITLHAPSGAALGSGLGSGSSSLDAHLELTVATNGFFTVRVSSYYRNAAGAYALSLASVPAAFQVSPSDQGGALTNGATRSGNLALGDMDMWSFTAQACSAIVVRVGTSGFRPLLHVYGPDGSQRGVSGGAGSGDTDALVQTTAAVTGTYTVLVQGYYANATGAYDLHVVTPGSVFDVASGDEGGLLSNGASQPGQITMGDLDLWSFEAAAGEHLTMRVGSPGFRPSLRVYGPGGKLLQEGPGTSSSHDAVVSLVTTNAGLFSAVVQSFYFSQTSSYRLNLGRVSAPFSISPGDEGGILTNGMAHAGTNALGDLDLYTFLARAGDNIALRIGAPDYRPDLRLYGPDGVLLQTAPGVSSTHDTLIYLQVTNTGIFTVLAQSFYHDGTGPYALSFGRFPAPFETSPGDEGGPLTNAVPAAGTISLGDLHFWNFGACRDSTFSLVCEKLSGTLAPRLGLYGHNGSLVATAQNASVATLKYRGTNSGRYTLLVDGGAANDAGTYRLTGTGIQEDALTLCPPVMEAAGMLISGYGGTVDAPYVLLSATNVALPRIEWKPVVTNIFDGFGAFEFTDSLPAESTRFFLLRASE